MLPIHPKQLQSLQKTWRCLHRSRPCKYHFCFSDKPIQGTGKGVLTACLMHPFDKCMGIELLDNLFHQSTLMKAEYDKTCKGKSFPKFIVEQGNMLDIDWSEADLVLANSTCFDQDLMQSISDKC